MPTLACSKTSWGSCPRSTFYRRLAKGGNIAVLPGLYVPADTPLTETLMMECLSIKQPAAVLNLVSALAFHGMTTAIPYYLSVALPRGKYIPKLLTSPVKVWYTQPHLLKTGIQEYRGDLATFRVTTPERTLLDCFRYRKSLGLDLFLEAAKTTLSRLNLPTLIRQAEELRILAQITPYLTAFSA
ncbi:MAG: hypothetical protein ACI4OZ_04365 [Akkermansia sp.]